LTESKARADGREVSVGRFPFTANGKAVALGETEGFLKVVADRTSGEILGVHILGPEATEMIHEFAVGRTLEATLEEIIHTIHAHPTLSEAALEATLAALGQALGTYLVFEGQESLVIVETFLEGLAAKGPFWIARGQCADLHGSGEAFMPVLEDTVLLLEDQGERPYRLDRMWTHLALAGVFARVRGIVLGSFTQCEEKDASYSSTELLRELAEMVVKAQHGAVIAVSDRMAQSLTELRPAALEQPRFWTSSSRRLTTSPPAT
jgi:hypothetical protein